MPSSDRLTEAGADSSSIGIGTHRIVKVQRIQNRALLRRYMAEHKNLTSQLGAAGVNEKYLLHGTGKNEPLRIATNPEGFMVEVGSDKNFYGKGCYFARRACYSHHYAHRMVSGDQRQLLVVRVLCGKSKVYQGADIDRSMTWHACVRCLRALRACVRACADCIFAAVWTMPLRRACSGVLLVVSSQAQADRPRLQQRESRCVSLGYPPAVKPSPHHDYVMWSFCSTTRR